MSQKDLYTEQLLKDRVEEHTFEFTEDRWDAMASLLESQQPPAAAWSWFGFSLNALVALVAGAGTFLLGFALIDPIDTSLVDGASAVSPIITSTENVASLDGNNNLKNQALATSTGSNGANNVLNNLTPDLLRNSNSSAVVFAVDHQKPGSGNGAEETSQPNTTNLQAYAGLTPFFNQDVNAVVKHAGEPKAERAMELGEPESTHSPSNTLSETNTAIAAATPPASAENSNTKSGPALPGESELTRSAQDVKRTDLPPGQFNSDASEYDPEGEEPWLAASLTANSHPGKSVSKAFSLRDVNRGGRGKFAIRQIKGTAHIRKTKKGLRWGNASHKFNNSQLFNIWDNPGYVGVEEGQNLIIQSNRSWLGMYRPKGRGIDNDLKNRSFFRSPTNLQIGYYGHLGGKQRTAIGVYLEDENQTLLRQTNLNLSFAHKFHVSKYQKLSLGVNFTYSQNRVYFDEISFGDMFDPRLGAIYSTNEKQVSDLSQNVDVSLGLFYTYKKFYAGAAVNDLLNPRLSYFENTTGEIGQKDLQREYHLTSGFDLDVTKKLTLSPSGTLELNAKNLEITPGTFAKYNNQYLLGVSYRNLNVVAVHAGWLMADHMRVLVAVGTPTDADLLNYGRIAYVEAGLRYQFGKRTHKTSILVYD